MLNPEVVHLTSAEVSTQIQSYFDIVDNSIKIGDTNHKYTLDQQASYAPSAPISNGSSTVFIISATCDNTADIYNSYITAKQKIIVKLDQEININNPPQINDINDVRYAFWVGYKNAMDSVEKYEILFNGSSKYQQSNAIEESYITSLYLDDDSKKADKFVYARHEDIFEKNEESCGAYIELPHELDSTIPANVDIELIIPLKIPLRRFLPLRNIKYLPKFCGKIELKITFGTSGLVYTPCSIPFYKTSLQSQQKNSSYCKITNYFVPIGEPVRTITNYISQGDPVVEQYEIDDRTLTVERNSVITSAYSNVPNFGIREEKYNELLNRYKQREFVIPIQSLVMNSMSNTVGVGINQSATQTLTVTPKFIDTFFVLFPLKANYKTCYKNPNLLGVYLRCGGFGTIPQGQFSTGKSGTSDYDPVFISMLQNALNVNGDLKGLNKDIIKSIFNTEYDENVQDTSTGITSNDYTNFIMAFPCETDNTFQQGQVSKSSITYELVNKTCDDPNNYYSTFANKSTPILAMLLDHAIIFKVEEYDNTKVEIGDYYVTNPY